MEQYRPLVLFQPVGTVHIRNMKILQRAVPEVRFRAICRTIKPWFSTTEKLAGLGVDAIGVGEGPIDDRLFKDASAILLSIAAPDVWVIDLMEKADSHGLPVIAIEEVHQLAMTDGAVNNYMLPVDRLFVASEFERSGFVRLGHSPKDVVTTGWPFGADCYDIEHDGFDLRELGLLPGDKIALLVLSCLQNLDRTSLETSQVRERMLRIAVEGLDSLYRLVIKGHPNEPEELVRKSVLEIAPEAVVLPQDYPIRGILPHAEVLLSRGNSQTVIEAILNDTPVCVMPLGVRTPFDETPVVCESAQALRSRLRTGPDRCVGESLLKTHLAIAPDDAVTACANQIRSAVEAGKDGLRKIKTAELVMYRNFMDEYRAEDSRIIRSGSAEKELVTNALVRLTEKQATTKDMLEIRERYAGSGLWPYLQSIYLWQAVRNKDRVFEAIECGLFQDFPPKWNSFWFYEAVMKWLEVLQRFVSVREAAMFGQRLESRWALDPMIDELLRKLGESE